MTTPTPRWTAETVDLVARALDDAGFLIYGQGRPDEADDATPDAVKVVLTALADAGVLTAVGGETRQEWIASLERAPRGTGLCDCARPADDESVPTSPTTGRRMGHHCECRAVIAAATLLGAYSRTIHAAECGHGTAMDEFYAREVTDDPA